MCVPKTIDNDIVGTTSCFGFDTAVSFATDAIDRLHTTAEAHRRVMVVEVMGRNAGWIALHGGVAGGADVILIPEIPYEPEKVAESILKRDELGARFSIVVVAEGATVKNQGRIVVEAAHGGHAERLGGAGKACADALEHLTGKETRHVVLGHLQRGGAPTAFDRALATRFGGKAVELILRGQFGKMVANNPPDIVPDPDRRSGGEDQDRAARLRPAADRPRARRLVRGLTTPIELNETRTQAVSDGLAVHYDAAGRPPC